MSATAALPSDLAPSAAAEAPRLERQLAILGEIAEIGLTLAQAIERQVREGEAAQPAGAAVAYGRVARAVRLTIALQSKLIAEAHAPADAARDRQRAERRTQVTRIVGRVVEADLDPVAAAFRKPRIAERLEQDDIYGDLLSRPASEIVAEVCQDLGVSPDWARLAAEAWARDEIASGAPGAPLARRPLIARDVYDDDALDDADDFGEGDDDPRAASP